MKQRFKVSTNFLLFYSLVFCFLILILLTLDFRFGGRNLKNLNPDSESAPPRYHVCQFPGKTNNYDFFGLNLPKNEFRGQN